MDQRLNAFNNKKCDTLSFIFSSSLRLSIQQQQQQQQQHILFSLNTKSMSNQRYSFKNYSFIDELQICFAMFVS
jgi:hypothetical protein